MLRWVASVICCLLLPMALPGQGFSDTWHLAQSALAARRVDEAAAHLRRLEDVFGREPAYLDPSFQGRFLPVRALVWMAAGAWREAAGAWEQWLAMAPHEPRAAARAWYALGSCRQQAGDMEGARVAWTACGERYPAQPEAARATLQRAALAEAGGATAKAIDLLDQLLARSKLSPALRRDGRNRQLRLYVAAGRWPELAALLRQLEHTGEPVAPADRNRAALAMLATAMDAEDAVSALTAARHVHPLAPGDPDPAWRLAQARAFLQAQRPREAATVFAAILATAPHAATAQAASHGCILALQELHAWEQAEARVAEHAARWPDDARIPEIQFLLARGWRIRGEPEHAEGMLRALHARHAGHAAAAFWELERGRCLADLGRIDAAFAVWESVAAGAQAAAVLHARLAGAETALAHRRWPASRVWTAAAAADPRTPAAVLPLLGWFDLRADFGAGQLAAMAAAAGTWLERHPTHPLRHPVALLRCEALASLGEWTAALRATHTLADAPGPLRAQAAQHAARALQALGRPGEAALRLEQYFADTQAGLTPLLADAVRLYAATAQAAGREAPAAEQLRQLAAHCGADPQATAWDVVVQAWERIDPQAGAALDAMEHAPGARGTLWCRLLGRRICALERAGQMTRAETLALMLGETLPPEQLDADGLLRVGRAWLAASMPAAADYFQAILRRYPDSPAAAAAHNELAALAVSNGQPEVAARHWQTVIREWPAAGEAIGARLALADHLLDAQRGDEAAALYQVVLTARTARGAAHARALFGLGRIAEHGGDRPAALGAYRRLTALYRAWPEWSEAAATAIDRLEAVDL
jgi:TolA-binding protein